MNASDFHLQDKRAPSDFPEVLAQKVVYAGQSLLALIGEIKRNAIVSDFAARNRDVAALRARYEAAEAASYAEYLDLQAQIQAVTGVCPAPKRGHIIILTANSTIRIN